MTGVQTCALPIFAHEALQAIDSRLAAETQRGLSLDHPAMVEREQTIADLQRVLAEEMEKLRANPDLDPVRKARAGARLAREARRAIELQSRLVADAQRGPLFDFAAMLEQVWEEAQPELERKKRDAERSAEMSADEPDGRAPNPA